MTRKGKEAATSSSQPPVRKEQNPGCIKERLFKVEDFEGIPDLLVPAVAFMAVLLTFGWRKFISDLPCDDLYKIYHGAKLDIGKHIYNTICHYASTMPTRNKMPYPCIITGICQNQKVHSPPGGGMLIHSDLLTDKSFGLRTIQLRSKRGLVEPEGDQDEEMPEGPSSAPPVVGRNPFERHILERLKKIEETQGVILANQDKSSQAFTKLFRHLNIPDDDE
ncbi:hypothetical protein OROMI_017972 [Orobanche minor]